MVNHSIQKLQIIFISIIIPIALVYVYINRDSIPFRDFFLPSSPAMRIGEISFRVEIANTDAERMTGLSGRDALTGYDGLLFVFPESGYYTIWMKDMRFPIDIIWIDENLKVVHIDKNISPDTYPRVFRPIRPVKYIVETNVHFSDTFSLHEGQDVILPIKYLDD